MLTLFAQYYVPKDKKRLAEINTCFKKNIENPLVEKFVIFFENEADQSFIPNYSKLEKRVHPARLTYRDWLNATQGLEDGSLSVLINSDIYLTQTLELLSRHASQIESQKRFIALSRHNPADNGLELNSNPHWTQDVWALVKPKEGFSASLLQEAGFELGQPGCDNKIAYIFHSHGYRVSNPCAQIVAVHLQANTDRSYNRKQDKLLGLHAFVYPSDGVTTDSKIELDLLTRSVNEPVEIRVNHWINDKKSYSLNAPTSIKESALKEASNNLTQPAKSSANAVKLNELQIPKNSLSRSVIDFEKIIPKTMNDANRRLSDADLIESHLFDLALNKEEVVFSDRFRIYSDDLHYFIYDQLWPYVKKVRRETLSSQLMNKDNIELFIQCFAPTNLSLENIQIGNHLRYQEDILFWQYPCRTEGEASDIHRLLPPFCLEGGEAHVYLPIPWATFIDKKKFPLAFLGLLGKRIEGIKSCLSQRGIHLRVHTVCQQIHFKRDLPGYLTELGITDLWTSHKQHREDFLDEVRLHSWPLYAVNYQNSERSVGLIKKRLSEKKYLASFVGAHMEHYLNDIRLKLKRFADLPDFCIEINNQWHFNEVVYEHQVSGKSLDHDDEKAHEILHYNQVLSDSIFSLCPSGAGPNSLRLWESLAIGSIPVILSDEYELPDIKNLAQGFGLSWKDAVVIFPEKDIDNLEQYLRSIPNAQREQMSAAGSQIYSLIEPLTCFGSIIK